MIEIDKDLPDYRTLVKFKNQSKPCMVIHADKAASDARVFKEVAKMLPGSDRGKLLRDWMMDFAGKFEQLDGSDTPAPKDPPPKEGD